MPTPAAVETDRAELRPPKLQLFPHSEALTAAWRRNLRHRCDRLQRMVMDSVGVSIPEWGADTGSAVWLVVQAASSCRGPRHHLGQLHLPRPSAGRRRLGQGHHTFRGTEFQFLLGLLRPCIMGRGQLRLSQALWTALRRRPQTPASPDPPLDLDLLDATGRPAK